eukprot:Colp12_sorted_trinity150504_noHs@5008
MTETIVLLEQTSPFDSTNANDQFNHILTSKDLDREPSRIRLEFLWHDQGSGEEKARVQLFLFRGTELVDVMEVRGNAPHKAQRAVLEAWKDEPIIRRARAGDHYEIYGFVGNQEGYSLHISHLRLEVEVPKIRSPPPPLFHAVPTVDVFESDFKQVTTTPTLGAAPTRLEWGFQWHENGVFGDTQFRLQLRLIRNGETVSTFDVPKIAPVASTSEHYELNADPVTTLALAGDHYEIWSLGGYGHALYLKDLHVYTDAPAASE